LSELQVYSNLAGILLALEAEMRRLELWSEQPPAPAALAGTEPFCIDTLDFHQWLQHVLLARMKIIIETRAELPQASGILAMAEECYRNDLNRMSDLLKILRKLDEVVSSALYP